MNNNLKLELPIELEPLREKFEKSVKPYVKINTKSGTTELWESKFRGNPYLPLNSEYPKDINGNPLKLLAQINFEEIPNIAPFPQKGILQFFISPTDEVCGLNFDDQTKQDYFKVIYFSDIIKDSSKLITDFSFLSDNDNDYFPIEKEGHLTFELNSAPVAINDFQFEKIFNDYFYNVFDELSPDGDGEELCDLYVAHYGAMGHKIGGYAEFTQSDPRENSNSDFNILLLQIDMDDELNIMWGDAGVANFFIKEEDLKNLDFSKILYNWDCC